MRLTRILGVSLLLAPAAASAGLVSPGQTVSLHSSDLLPPTGVELATKATPFVIHYGPADPAIGFTGDLTGTLDSTVYRDGGKLTFVYHVNLNDGSGVSGAAEGSNLSVWSFGGFKTTVAGALESEEFIQASRSKDGKMVQLSGNTPGLGGPPTLVVKTNATAYDAGGNASYFASDEVSTLTRASQTFSGTAMIDGTFRPVGGEVLPPGPPPTAIPLPPAAYSGLGVLLAMGLLAATKRVWKTA
jgi:hypothetical protein